MGQPQGTKLMLFELSALLQLALDLRPYLPFESIIPMRELKKQHSPKIYGYTILDVNWIRENPLHTPLIGRLPKNNDYFNASLIPPTDDNTAGLFCQDEYFEIISLTLEELAKRKHGWGTVLD